MDICFWDEWENTAGLAKILKKYDKRTGGVLRLPFIQKVLEQPFFTTDLISKLVKECETTIDSVFPASQEQGIHPAEREAITVPGEGIFRNTVAALLTMQEIRRGSSTYSHFSLPPLNMPEPDIFQSLQLLSPIPIPWSLLWCIFIFTPEFSYHFGHTVELNNTCC